MKKSLFLLLSICYLSVNAQNSYVVNTVGNTFSSDSLTINIGDTVTFNLMILNWPNIVPLSVRCH